MRSTADGEGERLSVDEARYWLGLPASRRGITGHSMTSSSADSADIAAGRGEKFVAKPSSVKRRFRL